MSGAAAPAAVLVVLVLAIGFAVFCLTDLARADEVRGLPKWGWAVVICISVPWGGIVYLVAGRIRHYATARAQEPERPPAAVTRPITPRDRVRTSPVLIEVDQLVKQFGPVTAVDGLSFAVRPGQVTGFLGPNGAGKTTTLRIILGLAAPSAGTALVGGRPYQQIIRPIREVGSLLDATAVHGGRTAGSQLQAVARSNGIGRGRVLEVLQQTGLEPVADRRIREFSLGMKQRLGIAGALLGDPPVLIFDEPVNGLDPEGVHWLRQLFRSLAAGGRTVLVSSHLMSEMALTAEHLIIIGRGRLLADVATQVFIDSSARRDVLVRSPRAADLARLLTGHRAVVVPEDGDGLAVTGLDAPAIADLAAAHGIPVHALVPRRASLEQAYLDLTSASTDYRAPVPAAEGTAR